MVGCWGVDEESSTKKGAVMEGVASIALLPCGSISGHFIQLPHSVCYGLHGTVNLEQLQYLLSFLSRVKIWLKT
ncbi:hypothetical protein CsSME_00004177 [Camellia sinensis var. sinensis]